MGPGSMAVYSPTPDKQSEKTYRCWCYQQEGVYYLSLVSYLCSLIVCELDGHKTDSEKRTTK